MCSDKSKQSISLERCSELKTRIQDYLDIKDTIPKGLSPLQEEKMLSKKKKILEILNGTESDWNDWKWQLKNRISDVSLLSKIINLTDSEIDSIKKVEQKYRWGITPYYTSLIDDDDKFNPIKLQSIPTFLELDDRGVLDPMSEEFTNPAGSITRRYPDRLIINVTNVCPSFCRHCQRRRNIGCIDEHKSKETLQESINYIKANTEIRDVLLTGGDALMLSDNTLDWLLNELFSINTVDYVRIGTRCPVTMPQRITDDLLKILKKYRPIYINTHFNHPLEITQDAKAACDKLANSGIPLGNQAVLLNGINNDKYIMRLLNQELLKCRVKPYYIFHAKNVIGTHHFNTSIDDGIEIMEYLRGYTSGMAIPTYIVNAPNGNGKTPLLPEYIISRGKNYVTIRTWEGKIFNYPNYPTDDFNSMIDKNN
ncbi:glutamate 2,3-aminomutase [Clostridium sp. NSJ-6]|uniref:Glutamate 2,3-aminomutase n=1 Tax=Clostridium hominis TaxID=2763036 RepID=A0ABR7DFU4_9CLOT|nr:glutamate 2,3-aminomutase [Clostridium hominis]MBC5629990.1 glutamate 2,3-aminomutase [Clostridium hominis]MDU2673935.1 glutamate 2,3-aminomutase [Clostridium sp.]